MSLEAAVGPAVRTDIVKLTDAELVDLGIDLNQIPGDFENVRTTYGARNSIVDDRIDLFNGDHWTESPDDESQYQLVLNYARNAILRYAAILSRKPLPRVPYPGAGTLSPADDAANRCERYLHAVWPDLWTAWRDVELDADKVGYGVLQIIWSPQAGQPETINVGAQMETFKKRVYTKCPFRFRAIPPKRFYPVYRTYDAPNDFQAVYRHDPGRLVVDLEEQYGVSLQATSYGPLAAVEGDIFTEPTCDLIELWTKKAYALIALTKITQADNRYGNSKRSLRSTSQYVILEAGKNPNPYGHLGFWVLQNIRGDSHKDPTYGGSLADMDDLGELNKHLEEMLSEHAQEIATHIHSPIVYKSEEHLNDPAKIKFAPGAVYPIGIEEELDTLQWTPNPAGVEQHLDRIFRSIQDLSFLGEAGFGRLAAGMSGIGFKIALTPMEQILELKTPSRVLTLEDVGAFLLSTFKEKASKDVAFRGWVAGKGRSYGVTELTPDDVGSHPVVKIDFGNLLPRDEYMHEQSEVYKWKAGAQSLLTTLDNIGVEDSQAEMNRIRAELQDEILNPEKAMVQQQLKMAKSQNQQMQQTEQGNQLSAMTQPGGRGQAVAGAGQPQTMQMGGRPPGMGSPNPMMAGPAGAIPSQVSGAGLPGGGIMGAGGGGGGQNLNALMQGLQAMQGGSQGGMPGGMQQGGMPPAQGMPPMVPPGVTGGPNTPPPGEEGQQPGRLTPFLPRR